MAKVSNREIGPARVYAKALLSLAESRGEADALRDELLEFKKFVQAHPEIGAYLSMPTMDPEKRRVFMEKTLRGRLSDLLVDALQVMNRKDRLILFPEVVEQYRLLHEELRGVVDVHVRTAVPLDEGLRSEIRTAAKNYSGKEPALIEAVDAELLGGLVVHIGDMKFDGSVAMRLRGLSRKLAELGVREIHGGKTLATDLTV